IGFSLGLSLDLVGEHPRRQRARGGRGNEKLAELGHEKPGARPRPGLPRNFVYVSVGRFLPENDDPGLATAHIDALALGVVEEVIRSAADRWPRDDVP